MSGKGSLSGQKLRWSYRADEDDDDEDDDNCLGCLLVVARFSSKAITL